MNNEQLRIAAQEACEIGPFRSTPEGGYRFDQRNVQDWLSAFGMARMRLPAVRSVLADAQGKPHPRYFDLFPLLHAVTDQPEVRSWIDQHSGGLPLASDSLHPSLAESLNCIEQLEHLADTAPEAVRSYDTELKRLNTPGLGKKLAARVQDSTRSAARRLLLLDIALATDPYPLLPEAVRIAADKSQPDELRHTALLLVELYGGKAHFQSLAGPLGRSAEHTRIDQQLQAGVIRKLLEYGIWTVREAAPHVQPTERGLGDDRTRLLKAIKERMTTEDARCMLQEREQHGRFLGIITDEGRRTFLEVTIERLVSEEKPAEADQLLAIDVTLETHETDEHWGFIWDLARRLGSSAVARRHFYEHGVGRTRRRNEARHTFWFALCDEDREWLLVRAERDWADLPDVWRKVHVMSFWAHEEGRLDDSGWRAVCQKVDQFGPGTREEFDRGRTESDRATQEHNRRMAEIEKQHPIYLLAEYVDSILRQSKWKPSDQMRELAASCWEIDIRPRNINGSWADLNPERKRQVVDACQRGLEEGAPTPIPDSTVYSGNIIAEAAAFREVFNDQPASGWLTPDRIRKWLPTALFAYSFERSDLIEQCGAVDRALTLEILLNEAERDLRIGRHVTAHTERIPVDWWTSSVADRVASWAENGSYTPEARAYLLELLTLRASAVAQPIALRWAELAQDDAEASAALRTAGLRCLLVLAPDLAWPLVERAVVERGDAVLDELDSLYNYCGPLRVNLNSWPTELLESLGCLLLRVLPTASDPDTAGRIVSVTATTQLRDTRGYVVYFLFERHTPEAEAALERLSAIDAGVRNQVQSYRARAAARALVDTLPEATSSGSSAVPLEHAVRLLDKEEFRLVRSSDDLLEAVQAALEEINKEMGHDLALLYGKPTRRQRSRTKGSNREHLEEDALQAYVRRRLTDLMPRFVPYVKVEFVREPQIGRRRRLDLQVLARCQQQGTLAKVVIECKWSDHKDLKTSMVKQLAKYLIDEQLTHGIYLVGWCGHWPTRKSGDRVSRLAMEAFLQQQRDEQRRNRPGSGLRIEPEVIPLEWAEPSEGGSD